MAVSAPAQKRKPVRPAPARVAADLRFVSVLESTTAPALKIDKDQGIVFGVKVVGRHSPNAHKQAGVTGGTEYTDAALKAACPLYEGISVMTNHPADRSRPGIERGVGESIGVLRNCRVEADGMRADLHYSRVHPMAAEIVEDVERRLGRFGLSHNARGDGQVKAGVYVVEAIPEVRSVDLVTRPATNRNLWESAAVTQTVPFKTLVESLADKLSKPRHQWLTNLLELDDMGEMPVSDAAPEASPEDAMHGGFESIASTLISAALTGDMDKTDALKKLKKLLDAHEKITGTEEPAAPDAATGDSSSGETDATEDDESDSDDEDKKAMKESLERLETLELKDKARDLCESLQFVPTKDQLAVLVEIRTDAARKTAAEAFKAAKQPAAPAGGRRPLSRMPGDVLESRTDPAAVPAPGNPAATAAWLRS